MSKLLVTNTLAFAVILLLGCSMNVKKSGDDAEKKVDIETPIGGIHVSKEADPRAIGLDVYPGAKPVEKEEDGQEKSANVNISTGFFGLKVVAQEYQSDATPDKLIDYYTRELKKYGNVLQCHGSWKGGHAGVTHSGDKSKQLKCDDSSGDATELKVGTEDNQHLVSIAPEGKGSKFALVLVQIRGKEDTI
ncbi:MAG TPA: hypothetical protein VMT53_15850 [Terriglobales bacterium]|nr:hypothetical protein [Terriglobales bacterium]